MNAQIASLQPLSAVLLTPSTSSLDHPARRHFVGSFLVRAEALAHFNELLAKLDHFPIDRDQLATASRDLDNRRSDGHQREGIQQRLQLAGAVDQMINDAEWSPIGEVVEPARIVTEYVHGHHELIPENLPRVGRLDDAILIDAAWPRLAGEVDCYLDYCRLRAVEAEWRGCAVSAIAFSREDWLQERCAETGLTAHCRRVGASSYLSASAAACFRVC